MVLRENEENKWRTGQFEMRNKEKNALNDFTGFSVKLR